MMNFLEMVDFFIDLFYSVSVNIYSFRIN